MSDNPGLRGLWPRAPARLTGTTLERTVPPALYDPFAPDVPLPDAAEIPHGLAPWPRTGLLVDALAQTDGDAASLQTFAGRWGLLTTHEETEDQGDFRAALVGFRRLCEDLLDGVCPARQMAPHLARVHPLPLVHGVRWAFERLIDAAYWQLQCLLGDGQEVRVCPKPGCGKLFVGRQGKWFCSERCRSALGMQKVRARRKEEQP